jgi:hypothetical protein
MSTFESRTTRVSFFGRVADEPTRRSVQRGSFRVALDHNGREPIYKDDGSFAFTDLAPQPTPYTFTMVGRSYRSRELTASLPTVDPVSLARGGEDELYVSITSVDGIQNRIDFAQIPFLPSIEAGAAVIGPGGFTAALQETIEGENVDFAVLSSIVGLAPGDVVRIVRSDRLLLRAGPYYPFSEPATVLSARFVESSPDAHPVAGVTMTVDQVNGVATTTVSVGGTLLHRVALPGGTVVLGPLDAVETRSNPRGEALLDFPAHLPVNSLRVQVGHPGYVPITQVVSMTAGAVTRWSPALNPI